MYSEEQVLRDKTFTVDFEDKQVTIHDLRNYEMIYDNQDMALANAFYPDKEGAGI